MLLPLCTVLPSSRLGRLLFILRNPAPFHALWEVFSGPCYSLHPQAQQMAAVPCPEACSPPPPPGQAGWSAAPFGTPAPYKGAWKSGVAQGLFLGGAGARGGPSLSFSTNPHGVLVCQKPRGGQRATGCQGSSCPQEEEVAVRKAGPTAQEIKPGKGGAGSRSPSCPRLTACDIQIAPWVWFFLFLELLQHGRFSGLGQKWPWCVCVSQFTETGNSGFVRVPRCLIS